MKAEAFFEELDYLVKRGANALPDSGIDIEALHMTRTVRNKMESRGNMLRFTIMLLVLLIAAIALFFLFPNIQKKVGFAALSEVAMAPVDTNVQIKQLTYEKEELLIGIDSLRKQIELMKSAPPLEVVADEAEPHSELGEDGIIRHVVERGETLYGLSIKYYGRGSMYEILQHDNKLKVPEDLAEGMTLKIYPEKRQP